MPPYVANGLNAVDHGQNQWYFNADAWATYFITNVRSIATGLPDYSVGTFDKKFLGTFSSDEKAIIAWTDRSNMHSNWARTPFGACLTVWSQIAGDGTGSNGNLNSGWIPNTARGVAATGTLNLPGGFCTAYFPIVKAGGQFYEYDSSGNPKPNGWREGWVIRFIRDGDGSICDRGTILGSEFEDSRLFDKFDFQDGKGMINFNAPGLTQYIRNIYSAMVYPVVCYSQAPKTVRFNILRDGACTAQAWFARPIVLPGVCSWFITQ